MSTHPWKGAAAPMTPDMLARAAERLGCAEATLEAVRDVEASGRPFAPDGSLTRRFEPHKMPGASATWRDSTGIGRRDREAMFLRAHAATPEAALRATSWGGPQIMGFNHRDAGYASAEAMVRAMADRGDAQVDAFVALIEAWGLASALRAHDWRAFARVYNGSANVDAYAPKLERAWRRRSGTRSPVVLSEGDTGRSVRELQRVLGIADDGAFGPETEQAVRGFQAAQGLAVDGIVGRQTWAALREQTDAKPEAQPIDLDAVMDRVGPISAKVSAGAAALEGLRRALPAATYDLLGYAVVALIIGVGALLLVRAMRQVA